MNKFTPSYIYESVYKIEDDFFSRENISCVLLDIDNTLISDNEAYADDRVCEFIKRLQHDGLKVCLISNNKKSRVESFNANLGLKYVHRARKPFTRKLNRAMRELSCDKRHTLFIGDQLLTDILAGNRAGIRTMLVQPINISKENYFFKIKRYIEKKIFLREFI